MRQLKISRSITNRSGESLDRYLGEISRIPMVNLDEEEQLAYDIRQGGKKGERAKDRLVAANLRFVVSVAKQYQHKGLGLTDLIDEGNIGLVKAAEKFDETRGFKFISYAVWWIRQSITEIEKFEQKNHRKPSAEELSDITNIDTERIESTMNADTRHMSIDAPFTDEDSNSLADILPSTDNTLSNAVEKESIDEDLSAIFNKVLKPREQTILRKSFGIGCQEEGPEEIGAQLGLTRERVRQIKEKSIEKIRKSGYVKVLAKYLG